MMNEQVAAIEAKMGERVSVGRNWGSNDDATVWASVNDNAARVSIQCPGKTAEQAVAKLYAEVCK